MPDHIFENLIDNGSRSYSELAQVLKLRPHLANLFDKAGNSLLHNAVEKESLELVGLLLNFGAEPNVRNNMGNTPLHFAVIIQNMTIIELLINNKANVNAKSNSGKTPLHLVSMQNNEISVQIAETLVNNSAIISQKDACGLTPMDYLLPSRS